MAFSTLLLQARKCNKRPKHDFEMAIDLCYQFCVLNKLSTPNWRRVHGGDVCGLYLGFRYMSSEVLVQPTMCQWSRWSKPGSKCDMTTFGVTAHELGHHWHFSRFGTWMKGVAQWEKGGKHKSITKYAATNTTEQLAEAFRLFVLNPKLLMELSPNSAKFFVAHGLKHPELKRKVKS